MHPVFPFAIFVASSLLGTWNDIPSYPAIIGSLQVAGTLWALEKKLDPIISEVQDIGKDVASGDYPVAELLTDIKGVVQGTSPNLVSRLRSKSQDSDLWDNDDGEKLPPADFAAESGKPRNGFLCRIFSATRTYLLVFFVIAVDLVLHFWITKTVTEYVYLPAQRSLDVVHRMSSVCLDEVLSLKRAMISISRQNRWNWPEEERQEVAVDHVVPEYSGMGLEAEPALNTAILSVFSLAGFWVQALSLYILGLFGNSKKVTTSSKGPGSAGTITSAASVDKSEIPGAKSSKNSLSDLQKDRTGAVNSTKQDYGSSQSVRPPYTASSTQAVPPVAKPASTTRTQPLVTSSNASSPAANSHAQPPTVTPNTDSSSLTPKSLPSTTGGDPKIQPTASSPNIQSPATNPFARPPTVSANNGPPPPNPTTKPPALSSAGKPTAKPAAKVVSSGRGPSASRHSVPSKTPSRTESRNPSEERGRGRPLTRPETTPAAPAAPAAPTSKPAVAASASKLTGAPVNIPQNELNRPTGSRTPAGKPAGALSSQQTGASRGGTQNRMPATSSRPSGPTAGKSNR